MQRTKVGVKRSWDASYISAKKGLITSSRRALRRTGYTYNHLLVLGQRTKKATAIWVKITSEASLQRFYYKPRVSKKFLAEHSKGLIGLRDAWRVKWPSA